MKSNLNYKNPKKNIKPKRPLTSKNIHKKNPNVLAHEESKRIYQTQGTYPNTKFLKQLNTEKIELYLNSLNPADVAVISKILPKYTYFQQLILGAFEPRPAQPQIPMSNYNTQKHRSSKSSGKLAKRSKNNIKESDRALFKQKIFTAAEKNLIISKNILLLSLLSFKIDVKLAKILSKGILDNKSLQYLSMNNCVLSVETFEILLKGVLTHEILRFLDLSNNKLGDNYCPMIARIIQRQTQRRDQIVWSYQLRNELPSDNNYKIGLISLNLHGNYLGTKSAKLISDSLNNDQYIRYIDLSKNYFDNSACKSFVHMMRKNSTLLTVDLRDNSGYDEFINPRIVMKMSKNIKILYSQYQNGEYSEEEFEYLKGFIDISFFDVDIPQEIVQYYNNNIQQTADNINNNNLVEKNNPQKNNIKNKDMNQIIDNNKKVNNDEEQEVDDINNNEMEQEQEQEIDNIKMNKEIPNKKVNNKSDKKINDIESNLAYQKNQNLIQENLKLKQEIQELKAKNLQSDFSKDKEKQTEEEKDLENYYNRANQIIDTLNEVMAKLQQHKDKNDNNININEINNLIENKKNQIIQEEQNLINEKQNIKKNDNSDNKDNKIIDDKNNDVTDDIKNKKNMFIKEKKDDKIKAQKENENNKNKNININNEAKINNNNIQLNQNKKEEIQLNKKEEQKNNFIQENKEKVIKAEELNKKEEEEKLKEETSNKKELNEYEEEEDEGDFNLDNLTEEEKMALIQQREILLKLQEEAEARGEHFDIQEYLAQLAEQSEEEDEFGKQDKSDKLNKSF